MISVISLLVWYFVVVVCVHSQPQLTCPDVFCLSQPITCTCQVNGNVLRWSVRYSNGSNVGSVTHFRPDDNFDLDTQYPLSNGIGFTSTLTNTTAPVVADLSFTAVMSLNGLSIRCSDDNALSANIPINTGIVESITTLSYDSLTYQSVYLQWSPPASDSSNPIGYYFINVTGISDCTEGICITNDTSYNVTGLMSGVTYNFTVLANTSVCDYMSPTSNVLSIEVPGVPDPVVDITYCMYRNSTNKWVSIQWTCPNTSTTFYSITYEARNVTDNSLLCPSVEQSTCSISTDYCILNDVTNGQTINVNVTAINIVGPSIPTSETIDINFSLLNVTVINTTSNSVTVRCTTTYTAAMGRYCKITINGTTNMSSFNGNTATVSITGLTYNTTYTYTASLVNISGLPLTGTCIIVVDNFTSDLSPPITTSTSISIIPTSTTTSDVSSSSSSATTSSTTSTVITSSTGPKETQPPLEAIAGGAAGGIVVIILIVIVIILLVYCVIRKKKSQTKVNLDGYREDDPDGPIALVNRKDPVPETGQPTYQDPSTIQRQEAPTGDLYAMPDKPNKSSRREAPSKPEAATYQDPNTIQRQEAPTGDLYALPAQKPVYSQVNKDRQQPGIMYAELGFNNAGSTTDQPRGAQQEVLYSDVQTKM